MKRKISVIVMTLILLCIAVTGCSGTSSTSNVSTVDTGGGDYGVADANNESGLMDPAADKDAIVQDNSASGENDVNNKNASTEETKEDQTTAKEEKLVYTCNMTIQTTDYQKTTQSVQETIKKYQGIIDELSETDDDYGWYEYNHEKTSGTISCYYVIRIPSKNYTAFLNDMNGKGKITSKSMNVENISRKYYDLDATIKGLEIQEERLLKMMKEAKNIEDMIRVEERLNTVQTEINQYKTQLSSMDTDVAYSTIHLNVQEVLEYKEDIQGRKTNKFSQRLINTLNDSWSEFLVAMEKLLFLLIRICPFAVVFGIFWIITAPFRKWYNKRAEKKRMERKKQLEERRQQINNLRMRQMSANIPQVEEETEKKAEGKEKEPTNSGKSEKEIMTKEKEPTNSGKIKEEITGQREKEPTNSGKTEKAIGKAEEKAIDSGKTEKEGTKKEEEPTNSGKKDKVIEKKGKEPTDSGK